MARSKPNEHIAAGLRRSKESFFVQGPSTAIFAQSGAESIRVQDTLLQIDRIDGNVVLLGVETDRSNPVNRGGVHDAIPRSLIPADRQGGSNQRRLRPQAVGQLSCCGRTRSARALSALRTQCSQPSDDRQRWVVAESTPTSALKRPAGPLFVFS